MQRWKNATLDPDLMCGSDHRMRPKRSPRLRTMTENVIVDLEREHTVDFETVIMNSVFSLVERNFP